MLETKGFENFIESVWHFLKADVHVLAKVFMLFFAIIGVCCIMFTGIYYIKRKLSNPLKYQRTPGIYNESIDIRILNTILIINININIYPI